MQKPFPISRQLRMINNKFREIGDKNLQKYNLTAAQLDVLIYLKSNGEKEIHQRQIEKWFQLKNPTVTGLLNRLEEKHFIVRKTNPEDRRYRVIELTEKGEQLLGQLWEEACNLENRMYSNLSEEEQKVLMDLLDRILNSLSEPFSDVAK
ncbi:MAG TPA: MarR family transcriptional regulator [Candidatus Merdisoma merdipullorum]|nr:MarR family transcriptional regulator [Candidatus Merdisoma merdipullorum]